MTGVVIVMLLLLFGMLLSRAETTPWRSQLYKVNQAHRAEWMAPLYVIDTVKRDYLAFYDYATATLPRGWVPYLTHLDHYLAEDMLAEQRRHLNEWLGQNHGRFTDILRANHRLEVRHFSADGTTCLIVDYQTERRIATYEYWHGTRVHTQDLGDAALVYQMKYDAVRGRWRIATYIQTLPPGIKQSTDLDIQLAERRNLS